MPDRESFVIEHTHPDGHVETVRVLRWEVFHRWRRRATLAFVAVVAVSCLGLYLAQHAGTTSDRELRREAQRAVTRSCMDRMDVRIGVAVFGDALRRLALRPARTAAEREAQAQFFERTQAPLDEQLTQAAGATIKTEGHLSREDIEPVRKLGSARCRALGDRFDRDASSGD